CESNLAVGSELPIVVNARVDANQLQLEVIDSGQGISNMDNIFVPFYTTKNTGSGIGLVLSRQIVRNHGGDLTLSNRQDSSGVIATISLPN
ncbi:MAG: ATP-binding protein, partial [Psychrobium sp.]